MLASRYDRAAERLAARWQGRVRLMTCEDLSVRGWRYFLGNPKASLLVLQGKTVALDEISGVVTRLPYVSTDELPHIVPADRAYVASEISAFLLCWLCGLTCPVVNCPTPECLTGPCLRPEQWVVAAARSGMRVRPLQRRIGGVKSNERETSQEPSVIATIIGDRCFGTVDQTLHNQMRRLAKALGIALLSVRFSSSQADATFLGATLCPEIDCDCTAEALIDYFEHSLHP